VCHALQNETAPGHDEEGRRGEGGRQRENSGRGGGNGGGGGSELGSYLGEAIINLDAAHFTPQQGPLVLALFDANGHELSEESVLAIEIGLTLIIVK
jgi:hypothetical protein